MSNTKATAKLTPPYEALALRWCSIFLSYKLQPFRFNIHKYLTAAYGKDADQVEQFVQNAFNSLKRVALRAYEQQQNGEDITLGPGHRHLHPDRFNVHGFHKLWCDDQLLHCLDDYSFTDELKAMIDDMQANPSMVRLYSNLLTC
jgi:hypothetical protein